MPRTRQQPSMRLQLVLTEPQLARIARIRELTGATSNSQVCRDALAVLHTVAVSLPQQDEKMFVRRANGELVEFLF